MPPRTAKPVQVLTEEHKRAQRIFARLVGGESNRLAPDRLRLKAAFQRVGDEVDKMEDRLARLDAAREALALRQAETGPPGLGANAAKRNRPQVLDNKGNREMADSPPLMISET